MKIKISEVHQTLLQIILAKSSLSNEEADILAWDYLEGELQGKLSHGIAAFPAMAEKLPEATSHFKILKETESFIYADAGGSLGAIVGRKLANKVIAKASQQGIAAASIRNMKPWLRPGAIAEYISDNNMVGFVVNKGTVRAIVPPGGSVPVFGTNPIGIGIPSDDTPVVVDMATSSRSNGEVRLAKMLGHNLPENSFIDKSGMPTLDPNAVHAALPMGGYKGFGIGLFIEIICGSLLGLSMGTNEKGHPLNSLRGAFILVIDPKITVGIEKFKAENQDFVDSIRKSPAAKGSNGVTLPGDRARKAKQQNEAKDYLEVDDKLWAEIKKLL